MTFPLNIMLSSLTDFLESEIVPSNSCKVLAYAQGSPYPLFRNTALTLRP